MFNADGKRRTTLLIQTERLQLEPISVQHSVFIYELLNTPEFKIYIGDRNINSPKEAGIYIKNRYLNNDKHVFILRLRSTGQPIGTCGLYTRDGLDNHDLGYAVHPHHFRKGYAYEAASQVMEYAKKSVGLKHLCAITALNNTVSYSLLKKLSFQKKGIISLPEINEELFYFEKTFN